MNLEERRRSNPEGFARQDRARELEQDIATLAARIHAASYRLIEMLGEFEALGGWSGWPSPAHWLSWRCGFSLNAAREKFRVARALPELPAIAAAFARGELSFAQVRAMTRIARPDNQQKVLMWAKHSTASQLERSFSYWEEDQGMVSFRIRLPAEQAAVVLKSIEAARDALDGMDQEDVTAETRIARINDPPEHPDEDVTAETRRAAGRCVRAGDGGLSRA
jgi:hypothetical protein